MVHCYIVYYLLINGKAIRGMGGSIDGKEENGGAPFPGRSGKSSNSKQL